VARDRVRIDPGLLKYYRHLRYMTQHELAEAARMSCDSVASYEQGRKMPLVSAFRRLVTALGISPEDVLLQERYARKPDKTEEP
jgi:transcriptional regulator with XRE-family HTH domain